MLDRQATGIDPAGARVGISTNTDVVILLEKLLSNQYVFFEEVSKEWNKAWGSLPKITKAITADISVSQLQWSFDGGLKETPEICVFFAEHCSLEVLQCAHANGFALNAGACSKAVARMHGPVGNQPGSGLA